MGLMTLSPSYCYAGDWREVCVVESACCIKINLKATVWVQSFHSLQVEIVLMHFSRTNANYNNQIILILLTNLLWANSDFILILWRRKVGEDKAITQQETTSPGHSVEVWCKSKSFKINHLTWQELRRKSQKYTEQMSKFTVWTVVDLFGFSAGIFSFECLKSNLQNFSLKISQKTKRKNPICILHVHFILIHPSFPLSYWKPDVIYCDDKWTHPWWHPVTL